MTFSFVDFCSGIGAGRLGLEIAGGRCLAESEINSKSENTYKLFFKNTNNLGDLTQLKTKDIPDCDILLAGFPCQTFSIMGKREGFLDTRGKIIYSLSSILKEKHIPYFIFENVKGLVNHNKGNTIFSIIKLLEDIGYKVFYKVLNSLDFGVPQMRERVYFMGIREYLYKGNFTFPASCIATKLKDFLQEDNNDLFDTQNATFQKFLNNKYNEGKVDINSILKEDYCVIDTRQTDFRVYKNKCPTLRTGRHGLLYTKGGRLHKLSGIEALLLQGFPKEYAQKAKDIPCNLLLSQAGNAMTVNVIEAIGKSLASYIGE